MTPVLRTTILVLTLALAATAAAQMTNTAGPEPSTQAPAKPQPRRDPRTSNEIRNQFSNLLREYPRDVATVLVLEPSLLANETFLAKYPELARFVAGAPEMRSNPKFYLAEFRAHTDSAFLIDEILEVFFLTGLWIMVVGGLVWIIRTVIEQKRWNRLSARQTDVHNRILERFGTSEELLEYVKTPAGSKYLEAAPIAVSVEKSRAPLTRIMWSIQLGVVVAIGAIGMLIVGLRFEGETSEALFVIGAIGFCVGLGFIASAAVSLFLSRRLGLWELPPAPNEGEGVR